jgi:hypothetical protein
MNQDEITTTKCLKLFFRIYEDYKTICFAKYALVCWLGESASFYEAKIVTQRRH